MRASRFPGVDPYLEDQQLWPDFHHTFITYWREALSERLPEGYSARINERFEVIERPHRSVAQRLPDVAVEHRSNALRPSQSSVASLPVGAIVLEPTTIPLTIEDEQRDSYIEVYRLPERKLVSVLELLSPTNKSGTGYGGYLNKRNEILHTDVSFVEVDLLLAGQRIPLESPLPNADYYAFVSAAANRPLCDVYGWRLRDRLPAIPIPLLPGDGDVWIDLQSVFTVTFDRGRFWQEIDYQQPLRLLLDDASLAWASKQAKDSHE